LKLVVEPGGAVGLAALLAGRIDAKGKNVVIVLSGGNVDADLFAKLSPDHLLLKRNRAELRLCPVLH
jgi:threonine dehydratase